MTSKIGKPMKLALFRDPTDNSGMEYLADSSMEKYMGIRVTEYAEVTFQPLRQDAFIQEALASLEAQEKTIRMEFQRKLDALTQTRANFLALTHAPTEPRNDITNKE